MGYFVVGHLFTAELLFTLRSISVGWTASDVCLQYQLILFIEFIVVGSLLNI